MITNCLRTAMSTILNSDCSLAAFNTVFTYNGRYPAHAFIGARARERKLLSAGTVLWKCTQPQ